MSRLSSAGNYIFFVLKFLVLVSVLVVLWWWILPYYGYCIIWVTARVLRYGLGYPVQGGYIAPEGLLNTMSTLHYVIGGSAPGLKLADVVTNLPPYVALVLATSGIRIWKRVRILGYGCAILIATHMLFFIVRFTQNQMVQKNTELMNSSAFTEIPTAFLHFSLTLPFLLWIVFAYWDKLALYFNDAEDEGSGTE
jgi:hypothetical protein